MIKVQEIFINIKIDTAIFFQQRSDTGLELNLLQKYVFLPLDIFRENMHNKGITDKLDAWLAFLSMDSPEVIVKLIKKISGVYGHVRAHI